MRISHGKQNEVRHHDAISCDYKFKFARALLFLLEKDTKLLLRTSPCMYPATACEVVGAAPAVCYGTWKASSGSERQGVLFLHLFLWLCSPLLLLCFLSLAVSLLLSPFVLACKKL